MIKISKKILWEDVKWIHQAKDGANGASCELGNELSSCITLGEFSD
jgi:hypothetical protein